MMNQKMIYTPAAMLNKMMSVMNAREKKRILLITLSLLVMIPAFVTAQDTRQDSLNTVYPGDDFSKVATSIGQFLKLEYGAAGAALLRR